MEYSIDESCVKIKLAISYDQSNIKTDVKLLMDTLNSIKKPRSIIIDLSQMQKVELNYFHLITTLENFCNNNRITFSLTGFNQII